MTNPLIKKAIKEFRKKFFFKTADGIALRYRGDLNDLKNQLEQFLITQLEEMEKGK
jgi:hypothetical protein